MLLYAVLIIVVIVLIVRNKELEENNNKQVNRPNFCPKCGHMINNNVITNFCPRCGHSFVVMPIQNIVNNNIEIKKEKVKKSEKEIKNTWILVIGSILVIFASIVFLTSTWSVTHNIIKTGILLFMLAVFLSVSYISDRYLNLKQASKAFHCIAFAYIPIILISISLFGLFGDFLAIYGDGNYIYLTISSILVSIIYYLDAKKRNTTYMFIFSVIFQLLSIIFFMNIFNVQASLVFGGLLIYNLVLIILYLNNKIYFKKNVHSVLNIVLFISMSSLVILHNLSLWSTNIFDIISLIIVCINMHLLLLKVYDKESIYKFIYPLLIILIFNNIGQLFDNMMFSQALILASFAFIFIYDILRKNKVDLISYIEVFSIFSVFNFYWLIVGIFNEQMIDSYILFGIMTFLSLISYSFNEKYKKFYSSMLAIGIFITSFATVVNYNFSYSIIGYVLFFLVLIDILIKKVTDDIRTPFKWIGIVSLGIVTLFNYNITIFDVILYLLYFVITLICSIKDKNDVYKIISYIYSNVVLFSIFTYFSFDYHMYVIPFTTVLITIINLLIPKIKKSSSDIYLIVSNIFAIISLFTEINIFSFIILLITSLVFILHIYHNKKDIKLSLIPLLGLIPYLYFNSNFIYDRFNIMYVFSVIVIAILFLFAFYKQKNYYIVMLFIFAFMHILFLEQIKYIGALILIASSYGCYNIKDGKVKDIYKGIIFTLLLVVCSFIIDDLGLSHISSLNGGLWLLFILIFTRVILKNVNGYKVWEYILFIFLNLISIGRFTEIYDSVIYIAILSVIVIVSYIFRYGPAFLISLISIFINILLLVRMLWMDTPWWLYILIIGILLIGFAIYNEAKDKNSKTDIKKHLDL